MYVKLRPLELFAVLFFKTVSREVHGLTRHYWIDSWVVLKMRIPRWPKMNRGERILWV